MRSAWHLERLGLEYRDHTAWCVARSTNTNGVLIGIHSNTTTGAILIERREDKLGPVLERIADLR